MSEYKFSPGQTFKLKPSARVTWLAFSNHTGSGISAIRSDSDTGVRLHVWIASGRPAISFEEQRLGTEIQSWYSMYHSGYLAEVPPDKLADAVQIAGITKANIKDPSQWHPCVSWS